VERHAIVAVILISRPGESSSPIDSLLVPAEQASEANPLSINRGSRLGGDWGRLSEATRRKENGGEGVMTLLFLLPC
jgi:hypothetical protein